MYNAKFDNAGFKLNARTVRADFFPLKLAIFLRTVYLGTHLGRKKFFRKSSVYQCHYQNTLLLIGGSVFIIYNDSQTF